MEPRIVSNPAILGGKPCIRGTRISVELILELAASGASVDDIVVQYPQLMRDDVTAAIHFAANFMRGASMTELEIAG